MSLALVFATIDRPHVAQRLINSVRRDFPDMPVYVADQSEPSPYMEDYYAKHDVKVAWMAYDSGVCASRNAAVALVEEEYFLLCDDDFIFTADTSFDEALKILGGEPDIGVVGGRLEDVDTSTEDVQKWMRYWELYFQYDTKNKLLITIPIEQLAPNAQITAGVKYYLCDAVMNFAVFRKAIFSDTVRWDPRFKSNGEHEDFYLNLKVNSDYKVAYLPSMLAEHHHPPSQGYAKLRYRNHGWMLFMQKWGLEQHLEVGLGLRTLADVSELHRGEASREKFFVTCNLDFKPRHGDGRSFDVEPDGQLMPGRYYDRLGNKILGGVGVTATFQLGMNGEFEHRGDKWQESQKRKSKPAPVLREAVGLVDVNDIALHVKYVPVVARDQDFVVFANPFGFQQVGDEVQQGQLVYSWRHKNSYLMFNEPFNRYRESFEEGAWNAASMKKPLLKGMLTFEINYLGADGNLTLLATGDVLNACVRSEKFENVWVTAWSPARLWRKGVIDSVLPSGCSAAKELCGVSVQKISDEEVDGIHAFLLSIAGETGWDRCNPGVLSMGLFPYVYGAGRGVCEHLPDEAGTHYLLPVSGCMTGDLCLSLDDRSVSLGGLIPR